MASSAWQGVAEGLNNLNATGMGVLRFNADQERQRNAESLQRQQIGMEQDRLKIAQDKAAQQKTAFDYQQEQIRKQENLKKAIIPASMIVPGILKSPKYRQQAVDAARAAGFNVIEHEDGDIYAPAEAYAFIHNLQKTNTDFMKQSADNIYADLSDKSITLAQQISEIQAAGGDQKKLAPLLQQQAALKQQIATTIGMRADVIAKVIEKQAGERPIAVRPGGVLVDPVTNQPVYTAPAAGADPNKNQTEEQLTAKALKGDKEAQAILDSMQKRKLNIAQASKDIKPTGSEAAKEELAQSLAGGDMTRIRDVMSLRSSGGAATALEIFNRARQINPKFSTAEIERKIKMESDFTTGKDGQNIQSFGTFLEHAGAATEALNAINSTNSALLNKPINYLKKNVSGDPNFQAFIVSLEPVRKEFEGFLLGGRALYGDDRKAAEIILNDNSSPAQIKSALKQMGHTAKARYQEMNYRYKRVMGQDIQEPFSPEAIQAATKIGVNLMGKVENTAPLPSGLKAGW